MSFSLKRGISTAIGIATMSIVSAGILGTSSFQQNSDDMVIANEIKFLSSYIYAANNRLSQDYYAINTNSTNKKQKGSIWAKSFDKDTTQDTLSNNSKLPGSPINDGELNLPFTASLHLFRPINSECSYKSRTHKMSSWNHKTNTNMPSATIPCNAYNIYGPLRTALQKNPSAIPTHGINTATTQILIKKIATGNPNPNGSISTLKEHTGEVEHVAIKIPVNDYIASSKLSLIKVLRGLTKNFPQLPIYLSISDDPFYNASEDNLGISSSNILGKKCTEGSSKGCYLNIVIQPNALGGYGTGGSGGCIDCLKLDGSNSMEKPITFMNSSAQYVADKPLIVWKSTGNTETPSTGEVVAGFVLGTDNQFELIMNEKSVFKAGKDGNKIDIGNPDNVGLTIDASSSTNLVELYNKNSAGDVLSSVKLDDNNVRILATTTNITSDTTITPFSSGPALKLADSDYYRINLPFGTVKGYYKLAEIPKTGLLFINGAFANETKPFQNTASINLQASYAGLNNQLNTSANNFSVSGFVFGNTSGHPDIVFNTPTGKLTDAKTTAYIYIGDDQQDVNINAKVVGGAKLLFDGTEVTPGGIQVLSIASNNSSPQNSKIVRVDSDGYMETDSQDMRISKPLDQWPEYPGDCAYSGTDKDCPTKATELATFLSAVPNIEKTIDLIKSYTPNKYIAYEGPWTEMRSTNKATQTPEITGTGMDSAPTNTYFTFSDKTGTAKEMPNLPHRVKVIVRNHKEACRVPPNADSEGYVYQEASARQNNDDDVEHLGASAVQFNYSKKGIEISAAQNNNGINKARFAMVLNADGWGGSSYSCAFVEVKAIAYRPEIVSQEVVTVVPPPIKTYDSGWFSVKSNYYTNLVMGPYSHDLGKIPSRAFLWASDSSSGSNMALVDSLYGKSSGVIGTYLANVSATHYSILPGGRSSVLNRPSAATYYFPVNYYLRVVLE